MDTLMDPFRVPEPLTHAASVLCGGAGSGKTTLARQLVAAERGTVLAASTGIASVNLGEGTTINALLGYFDTASLVTSYTSGALTARLGKLWRSGVRRIILDEMSMVAAEQITVIARALDELAGRGYVLDAQLEDEIEASLGGEATTREWPIALTLVGDFCQLPPVKAPFAFESPEWDRFGAHTETLTRLWRQTDPDFIQAVRAARRGEAGPVVDYFAPRLVTTLDPAFPGLTIFARNEEVDRYNALRMDSLKGTARVYQPRSWGTLRPDWKNIPAALTLKEGALVMILANAKDGSGLDAKMIYANGDLGVVRALSADYVYVELHRTGEAVCVVPVTRNNEVPLEPGRRAELKSLGQEDRIRDKFEIVGQITYLPVRVAYGSTVHKCVAGDTRIQTTTRGVVEIQHLRVDDVLPSGIVRAVARAAHEAYRVTTTFGYDVVASADHRWVTERGLCATAALMPGQDRVQLAIQGPTGGVPFSADIAYWLGLLVGDGNYTDRDDGTLHFAAIDYPELGDLFIRGALTLGAARCSWRKDRRGVHTSSKRVRQQLLEWGLDYVKGPAKRIPSIIWSTASDVRAAFLRGLFDTDGSAAARGVIYCTASQGLARDVHEMLLGLGVIARRQEYPGRRDPYYQVYISARNLAAFRATVGFGVDRKRRRLAEALPNRSLHAPDNFDTIASVDPLGVVIPMYDVEITAPHLLGFGPLLGHNCQGLTLDTVQVNTRDGFFKQPGLLYVALSRCRSSAGLRLIGTANGLKERVTVDPRVRGWV